MPARVTDDLVEQRILEAYAGGGRRCVVTGWAGLRLLGGGWFDGLAIVDEIVKLHAGSVQVTESPAAGARLRVRLPVG